MRPETMAVAQEIMDIVELGDLTDEQWREEAKRRPEIIARLVASRAGVFVHRGLLLWGTSDGDASPLGRYLEAIRRAVHHAARH